MNATSLLLTPSPGTLGLLEDIADYVYRQAPRPTHEAAMVAAIALSAGIYGRAFNVSETGLNVWLLLLAPTGTGKDAIASGISKLLRAVAHGGDMAQGSPEVFPAAKEFVSFSDMASGQAMHKHLAECASTLFVNGEAGISFSQMNSPKAPQHIQNMKKLLLMSYSKSGAGETLGGIKYSEREKDVPPIASPALSIVAESVPETVFALLDETQIADGFMPRWTIIDYPGDRPYLNEQRQSQPPAGLVRKLAEHCELAHRINQRGVPTVVGMTGDAARELRGFNDYCDSQIRGSGEVHRQLWNRAHLKAMKLAAIAAVAVDPHNPVVTFGQARWAAMIENDSAQRMLRRYEAGEVGDQSKSDKAQQEHVRRVIREWVERPWSEMQRYKIADADVHGKQVIPWSYISKRLTNVVAFKNARNGATSAIRQAVKELVSCGEIARVPPAELSKITNSHAEFFTLAEETDAFGGEVKRRASEHRRAKQAITGIFPAGTPPGEEI
ncbi:MAG: hypothetical protein AAF092_15925 [Pseudomonadota bacterium]